MQKFIFHDHSEFQTVSNYHDWFKRYCHENGGLQMCRFCLVVDAPYFVRTTKNVGDHNWGVYQYQCVVKLAGGGSATNCTIGLVFVLCPNLL